MNAKFSLLNVDQLQAEMTIKMSMYEWKKVRDTLVQGDGCSSWQLGYRIRDMVSAAEKVFEAKSAPTQTDIDNQTEND
jgi:hypothetical protein